ncbi:hypothetical protein [Planctomicrobium sp. SH527]|uniref:hypothetical protein n=1 Tax=Planctomicrobium sp. SH527 TaxID=3448123 RepID=UPI003F5C70DD
MMISSTATRTIPRLSQPVHSRLELAEATLRCRDDIPAAIADIMSSMGGQPFSATDGFAVQIAASEALESVFKQIQPGDGNVVQLRFSTSPEGVWIEINGSRSTSAEAVSGESGLFKQTSANRNTSLVRSLMTSVEYRDQGRHVILTRGRGKGSTVLGPPSGYDFQI